MRKEKKLVDLTLSELVDQSLAKGLIPIFEFLDKNEIIDRSQPENKSNDSFQWSADLVKEFCEYAGLRIGKNQDIRQQLDLLMEDFKQSHTPKPQAEKPPLGVKPDWLWIEERIKDIDEALERASKAGVNPPASFMQERLELVEKLAKQKPKAENKQWDGYNMLSTNESNTNPIFKADNKPDKLFTTEDGKDIFPNGKDWQLIDFVDTETWKRGGCSVNSAKMEDKRFKFFSTKEAAEKYISDNKPEEYCSCQYSAFAGGRCTNCLKKVRPKPQPQKEEQRIEVTNIWRERGDISNMDGNTFNVYQFNSVTEIPKEKLPLIKQAIEQVLNDEFVGVLYDGETMGRIFTQQQVDAMCEDAFNKARETSYPEIVRSGQKSWRYKTFQDYQNSKK